MAYDRHSIAFFLNMQFSRKKHISVSFWTLNIIFKNLLTCIEECPNHGLSYGTILGPI
jgi:hypothetical protein